MKKVCWHYFSMRAKWDEGKIHDGKIQQKTCIQRNKFNYLCCQLQIIVKDSKQLLRNAKAMSICDYFAVDSTSFNQTYFYISTAYEFFSKNVYFFAVSFGWRSDKYIFCFFGKSRIALHFDIEKIFYGYLMKDSFWQQGPYYGVGIFSSVCLSSRGPHDLRNESVCSPSKFSGRARAKEFRVRDTNFDIILSSRLWLACRGTVPILG